MSLMCVTFLACHCDALFAGTVIKGVPNNVEFLRALVEDPRFAVGDTTTKFLEDFHFTPRVVEVVLPGQYLESTRQTKPVSCAC